MMDWESLTQAVVEAVRTAFGSLIAEKADEHFYAFALYTDEYAETVMPSANSVERYEANLRDAGEIDQLQIACYKWGTAEWAYEAWGSSAFTQIYRDLAGHRRTMPDTDEAWADYRQSVHECMISALERLHTEGFFAERRDDVTLFISSSDDDDAFEMENESAKRLNSEQVYTPFRVRYGADDAVWS